MDQTGFVARSAAVLTMALGLAVSPLGAPSQAAVHQHGDAYGDTSSREVSPRTLARPSAAPVPAGDITSLIVAHQYETVDVMVEMTELERTGDAVAVRVRMAAPRIQRVIRVADVLRDGEFRRVVKMRAVGTRALVSCEGLDASLDYKLDTATVRVPRTCLGGDPDWVRVGATSRLRDGSVVQLDDAQRDGRAPRRTTLSPRVAA